MADITEIKEIAEQTRQSLYNDWNTSEEEDPTILEGHCHENAWALARDLYDLGYPVIFVWGALSNINSLYITDVEHDGSTHHWVEIPQGDLTHRGSEQEVRQNDTVIADPYALGQNEGEVYVSTTLPRDYQRVIGGFIKYEPWMEPNHFLGLSNYRDLPEDVFIFEKTVED